VHSIADLLDGADGLMAEDATVRDLWYVPLEDVQVGAADSHRVDSHDGIFWLAELWTSDVFPRVPSRTVIDKSLHRVLPAAVIRLGNTDTAVP
jgi:hypothetical protein